jgi:hypothetical protein
MKKNLFFMMIAAAIAFAGCNKNDDETPPLAATTQTWTFGEQTWSDAIHCPECNKETFEDSYTEPQCRSYTENGKTWYYYNWAYVNTNKNTMCPDPWRVPIKEDFEMLISNTNAATLTAAWGYGGSSSECDVSSQAYYWNNATGYYWYGYGNEIDVSTSHGFQVRCVKDN